MEVGIAGGAPHYETFVGGRFGEAADELQVGAPEEVADEGFFPWGKPDGGEFLGKPGAHGALEPDPGDEVFRSIGLTGLWMDVAGDGDERGMDEGREGRGGSA